MKRLIFGLIGGAAILLLTGTEATATTYSLKASAKYNESLTKYYDSDLQQTYYDITTTASSSISAVFPLSGSMEVLNPTSLSLATPYWEISPSNWDGDYTVTGSVDAKKLIYKFYAYDENTGDNTALYSTIQVSWNTSALTVAATFYDDIFGAVQWADLSDTGTIGISDTTEIYFDFGNQSYSKLMDISGTDTVTTQTISGYDYTLNNISVSGTADMIAPALKITSPSKSLIYTVTNNNTFTIQGTASDASGIMSVYAYIYTSVLGDWQKVSVTDTSTNSNFSTWSLSITPEVGTNLIYFYAEDPYYNQSAVQMFVFYTQPATLTLITNGAGKISVTKTNKGGYLVGPTYKVTLTPDKGYILADWAVYSINSDGTYSDDYDYDWTKTFSFTLPATNTFLTATFIPNPFTNFKATYSAVALSDTWYDTNGNPYYDYNSTNLGSVTLSVTTSGAVSGKWIRRANTISFSGTLYAETYYSLPSAYTSSWSWDWRDYTNDYYLDCFSSNPQFWFRLKANDLGTLYGKYFHRTYNSKTANYDYTEKGDINGYRNWVTTASPNAGTYNITLLNDMTGGTNPASMGYTYGTVKITSKGAVSIALSPADGITSSLSTSSAQAEDGSFRFFAPLYSKGGFIAGWLSVTNGTIVNQLALDTTNAEKQPIYWTKPQSKTIYYPAGFTNSLYARGVLFTAPKTGTNIFGFSDGTVSALADSNTVAVADLTFLNNTFKVSANDYQFALTLSKTSGGISGSFVPAGGKKTTFKGLFVGDDYALGFYKDAATTGSVIIKSSETDSGFEKTNVIYKIEAAKEMMSAPQPQPEISK